MHRAIVSWLGICLCATGALADCAEEVTAAWKRLHAGPFTFEMKVFTEAGHVGIKMTGAIDWPKALHFRSASADGEFGQTFIEERHWYLIRGKWDREGTYGGSIDGVIQLFEAMFGFQPDQIAKGVRDASCLGRVLEDGSELIGYEYRVNKGVMGGEVVSYEKLYVDTTTGFPIRQVVEVRPRFRSQTEFRFDAAMRIEPPAPSQR